MQIDKKPDEIIIDRSGKEDPWTLTDLIVSAPVIFIVFITLYILMIIAILFQNRSRIPIAVTDILKNPLYINLVSLFFALSILGATIYWGFLKYKISLKEFGFRPWKFDKKTARTASLLPVIIPINLTISWLLSKYVTMPGWMKEIATDAEKRLGFIIMGLIVAPVIEELYFRGFAYRVLKSRFGFIPGVIISGIFFAFFHLTLIQFIPTMILGVYLAFLFEYSESLWTPMLFHFLNNACVFLLLTFSL